MMNSITRAASHTHRRSAIRGPFQSRIGSATAVRSCCVGITPFPQQGTDHPHRHSQQHHGRHVSNRKLLHHFSTSTTQQNLSELLSQEATEEELKGITKMPGELASLRKKISERWDIVDEGATVSMRRKEAANGNKVAILFHCQDNQFDDEDDSTPNVSGKEDEKSSSAPFILTVSNADKTIVMRCLAQDGIASPGSISVTTQSIEMIHESGSVNEKLYQVSTKKL